MRRELTIATPCYNEAESLPTYFQRIDYVRERLTSTGWCVTLLLINDGSRDGTGDLLTDYARTHNNTEVVNHPRNLGYGAAIKTALAVAQTGWIVFADADTNYDQAIILELAEHVTDETDLLNVSIFAPGGASAYPWYRMLLSKTASLIYRTLLPRLTQGVFTMTCGFRWYRRAIVPMIFPHANSFVATAEIMLRALSSGLRVVEFPACNTRREHGVSKMRFVAVSLGHLRLATQALLGRLGPPLSVQAHLQLIGYEPKSLRA